MERIPEPDDLMVEFGKAVPSLMLASSSPNRRALLEAAGSAVQVYVPDADEAKIGESPEEIVMGIAGRKMEAYLSSDAFDEDMIAIAADTLVLIDGSLIGKPGSRADAKAMLESLSGRMQSVISAAAIKIPGRKPVVIADEAYVIFRKLTNDEIEDYIATGEWMGAAGGYRLQKTGYRLIERIDGDWTTVVGLPLRAILETINSIASP